jgi:outer membrane scaffolding protein for murein synthesis (MipA/OmpV family)
LLPKAAQVCEAVMRSIGFFLILIGCLGGMGSAWAEPIASPDCAPQPASEAESPSPSPSPECKPAPERFPIEGAFGPVADWSIRGKELSWTPGFYLRYRRWSLSNNGHFAVRRRDDIFRGVSVDIADRNRLTLNLGLRFDPGGRASDLSSLDGYDRIKPTVRLRASAIYRASPYWGFTTTWNGDIGGRGGGQFVEFGVSRDEPLGSRTHWALGLGLSAADARYQRLRFGVSPIQAELSGLPVYRPQAGLLNASFSSSLRFDINPHWVSFVGISAVHHLGPQLHSPFVPWSTNWTVGAGIARRF